MISRVAAFLVFTQVAPTPGWPASAGAPPQVTRSVFYDPPARYFDPPAGRYRLPDGTIQYVDPPRGFYDPPPGQYPVDLLGVPTSEAVLGPLPTAEASVQAWLEKRRRLRIGLGISLGAIGVGVLAGLTTTAIWNAQTRRDLRDGYPPGVFVDLAIIPAALIATIVYGIRLGVHARRRPGPPRVQVGAGGLRLAF
jgi:hypothetical protein